MALSTASTIAGTATAQGFATMPQASDADRLASAMRTIGGNPRDVGALITAGELSLRLGDAAGAAALFKRAEQIEPMNGRVRAGMASILVHEERPGEALRYFIQAEGYGLAPERFAAERGLAYDLVGQQERAQRDYRLALRTGGANDEVIRRYALSLGISGRRDLALEQIDTLLRRSDRGAWRVRAFVLAMNGDVPGAERIATSMMPPGTAGGLTPFFARLAGLGAVDRAFAVHFGETRTTPARVADARMVPQFGALPPDPYAPRPVQVAAAAPVAAAKPDRRERRRRERDRDRDRAVQLASVAPVRAAPVLPAPPAYAATVQPVPGAGMIQPLPGVASRSVAPSYAATARPAPSLASVQPLASVVPRSVAVAPARSTFPQVAALVPRQGPAPAAPTPQRGALVTTTPTQSASAQLPLSRAMPAALPIVERTAPAALAQIAPSVPRQTPVVAAPTQLASVPVPAARAVAPVGQASAVQGPAVPRSNTIIATPTQLASVLAPATRVAGPVSQTGAAQALAAPAETAAVRPAATKPFATGGPAVSGAPDLVPAPSPQPVAVAATTNAPAAAPGFGTLASAAPLPVPPRSDNDSILARIIANISVPGAELEVAPVRPEPAVAAVPAPVVTRAAPVEVAAVSTRSAATKLVVAGPAKPDLKLAAATRAAERKAAKDAAAKKIADASALAAKKAAADARALAAKEAAEEKRIARSQPPRIWVQVAGGAEEGDLPKAFASVRSKASALAGREAYSTPLRATNRVLTGPFKTEAEARSFVNQLAKQGVSAFSFTSAPGQKVTKLAAKSSGKPSGR